MGKSFSAKNYYSRVDGIVSADLHNKHVFIIGVGAGSDMALKLARLGPAKITLIDPDTVEIENLCRTAYTTEDIGKPKVEALARHIHLANPFVECEVVAGSAGECLAYLDNLEWYHRPDLTIAGTDQFKTQAAINRWSIDRSGKQRHVPTIFIGAFEDGLGGMILWSLPGEAPCLRCSLKSQYDLVLREGQHAADILGGRASLVDIGFIDHIALKIGLGILDRYTDSVYGKFFQHLGYRNLIIARNDPSFRWGGTDIFDIVLSDLPTKPKNYKRELQKQAFFAMDSLWLSTDFDEQCPDCGGLKSQEEQDYVFPDDVKG